MISASADDTVPDLREKPLEALLSDPVVVLSAVAAVIVLVLLT